MFPNLHGKSLVENNICMALRWTQRLLGARHIHPKAERIYEFILCLWCSIVLSYIALFFFLVCVFLARLCHALHRFDIMSHVFYMCCSIWVDGISSQVVDWILDMVIWGLSSVGKHLLSMPVRKKKKRKKRTNKNPNNLYSPRYGFLPDTFFLTNKI